jgi:hypothetical protein
METSNVYCVVYFPCYHPRGYRAYDYNDQYLADYPSMGEILEPLYATMQEAQDFADRQNDLAQGNWERYLKSTEERIAREEAEFLADLENIWSDLEAKGLTI